MGSDLSEEEGKMLIYILLAIISPVLLMSYIVIRKKSETNKSFFQNKLTDIIEGSTDANILLMTDDDNGDASWT